MLPAVYPLLLLLPEMLPAVYPLLLLFSSLPHDLLMVSANHCWPASYIPANISLSGHHGPLVLAHKHAPDTFPIWPPFPWLLLCLLLVLQLLLTASVYCAADSATSNACPPPLFDISPAAHPTPLVTSSSACCPPLLLTPHVPAVSYAAPPPCRFCCLLPSCLHKHSHPLLTSPLSSLSPCTSLSFIQPIPLYLPLLYPAYPPVPPSPLSSLSPCTSLSFIQPIPLYLPLNP